MRQAKTLVLASLVVIIALGFISTRTTANDPDPILESFERELNHEPSPAPRARRDDILEDELYRAINSIHWTRNNEENVETQETNKESLGAPDDR